MQQGSHDSSGSLRWLLTYADMITLLLAFFVILYAISKVDLKRYDGVAVSLRGAFKGAAPYPIPGKIRSADKLAPKSDLLFELVQELRTQLGEDLKDDRIQIERGADKIILRFQDAILFERGRAELRSGARRLLGKVASVIRPLPNQVEAEGHTDLLPIRSGSFPSNWELSTARATAVVRFLVEEHGLPPSRLAARGMGEHQPLYPNDPVKGEPRNRRVEIRILTP
jgi:chemotaxis protein MotB